MWNKFRSSVKIGVEFLWFSYSTPTPQNGTQIFILLLFCLAISIGTGGLLFHWLNGLLKYETQTAAIVAGIYAGVVAILSFLVHPLRCALTLTFPTLGTRQGRKLILTMCAMIVALYILPNIATNISTITHLIKCTSENLAHSLLNSSDLCNSIKSDMIAEVQNTEDKGLKILVPMRNFDHSTNISVVKLRERLRTLSNDVEEDFSNAKRQLEEVKLLASRILGAAFVFCLLKESSMYLKSYLTSLRFDNVYITGVLRRTAADRGIQVEAKDVKNGINSTSFRMTKRELIKCIIPILLITLYLVMTVILILLDRIVHYLVITGGPWLLDVPSTGITMQMNFKVEFYSTICELFNSCSKQVMVDLSKVYRTTVSSDASRCEARPSELDPAVLTSLALLYLLAYCIAALQVYAQRLRRKVASSFFPRQEKKRIEFLIQKILVKKRRWKTPSAEAESKSMEEKMRENR